MRRFRRSNCPEASHERDRSLAWRWFAAAALTQAFAEERIERFISEVDVQRNGDLIVTETIQSGPKANRSTAASCATSRPPIAAPTVRASRSASRSSP